MPRRRRKRDQVFAETVGAILACLRRAAGLSQEGLGFQADVHRTAVGQVERGGKIPQLLHAIQAQHVARGLAKRAVQGSQLGATERARLQRRWGRGAGQGRLMSGNPAEPIPQLVSNLSCLMDQKGLSPTEVAARADLRLNHLSLILDGKRMIQLDTLVKLAGALGVAPAQLLVGVRWVSDSTGGGEFRSD